MKFPVLSTILRLKNASLKGKAQYSWPPCSKDRLLFMLKIFFTIYTKHAILMRRSTILSLPFQLVFSVPIKMLLSLNKVSLYVCQIASCLLTSLPFLLNKHFFCQLKSNYLFVYSAQTKILENVKFDIWLYIFDLSYYPTPWPRILRT